MMIYLVGLLTAGNLEKFMKIYLVDFKRYLNSDKRLKEAMKVFLAGEGGVKDTDKILSFDIQDIFILESYYYLRSKSIIKGILRENKFRDFLLDSGAFTYMSSDKGDIDFDNYIEEYADFINEYNIQNFFELDIDSVVGLEEVERLRDKLELLTDKQCIPVWHKSRGREYFIRMCKEYPYVALGGIVAKEFKRGDHKYFPWFINTAHEYGAKIHGLGYTNIEGLKKYSFDSVDSTSWLYGNISGYIYHFHNGKMVVTDVPDGMRLKSKECALHNFGEWVKFQKWAINNL